MKLYPPSSLRATITLVSILGVSVGIAGRTAAFEVDSDWEQFLDSMDFSSSHGSTGDEAVVAGFLERTGNAKLHPFGAVLLGVRPYGKLGLGLLPGREMGRSSHFYDRISNASLERDTGVVMRFGAGADLPLGKSWSLQAGFGYDRALSETIVGYDALTATGGFALRW